MENREIKFRAWDGKNIIYPDLNGWFNKCDMPGYNKLQDLQIGTVLKKLTVMQFTGLQDKNGKDIYEGDVISFGKDFEYKYIVEFIDGCFMLVHSELKNDYDKKPIVWGNLIKAIDDIIFKAEVIGNIYSNPELL